MNKKTPPRSKPMHRNPGPKKRKTGAAARPRAIRPEKPVQPPHAEDALPQLFFNNPLPMWVYDLETLAFLEVNHAATAHYGYSRGEFLGMRITDIRPQEDVPRLLENIKRDRPDLQDSGIWRHRLKDGRLIEVEISSHRLKFAARNAALIVAQDITRRRSAEERFRLVVESVPNAIVMVDADGRIDLVNSQTEKLFGYSREELIGRGVEDLVPERFRGGHSGYRAGFMIHPSARPMGMGRDLFGLRKDGSEFPVEIGLSPIAAERGVTVIASIVDITERKRAESRIRELAEIVENSEDAILRVTLAGIVTGWNKAAEKTYGYRADEIIGKSDSVMIPPDRPNELAGMLEKIKAGESIVQFETERIRKDGARFWVSATVSPIRNELGEITAVSAVVRDITERKRAGEELSRSYQRERMARAESEAARERLSFLADASALLAETFDYHGRLKQVAQISVPRMADWCAIDILEADESLQRVAVVHSDPAKVEWAYELQRRYPPDPDAPRGIYNVLRTGRSEFYPQVSDSMLAAAARDEEQLKLARSLGFKSAMVVPFQANGRHFGAITLVMAESGRHYTEIDLTLIEDLARRATLLIDNARLYEEAQRHNAELETRVQERTAELAAINQELEAFSYSVSHDLRAPLRHVAGYVELLTKSAAGLDEKSLRYLRTISESAARMGALIDDLLEFSRMGRAKLRRSDVKVDSLIQEVVTEFQPELENREVQWLVGNCPDIHGDRAMIRQVFANLIANALKFTRTRSPARIEIGTIQGNSDETTFFVRDNGVGFDMRYTDKLFGIFQRLHRADEFEGTGVGLANVRRIVHRHGGRAWAESQLDQGATFYFSIPYYAGDSDE